MKKSVKAFTLIECIIALCILGIASSLLVQAYSQLARVTTMNNTINNSIALQMADAENLSAAESKGALAPQKLTTASKRSITITLDTSANSSIASGTANYPYSEQVDVYAVKPYDTTDTQQNNSTREGMEYRYIYFHR